VCDAAFVTRDAIAGAFKGGNSGKAGVEGRKTETSDRSKMETVVIVIHLMVVLALVLVVLLQRSEGGGLGMGGGGGGFMSSRGTANVLTRATAILAAIFFATSLGLSLIARMGDGPASILDGSPVIPGAAQPADGAAPSTGGGVLDVLKQQSQPQAPATAPAQPAGPQVPAAQ
jgi:preprotein translocase subunit SecG